MTLDQAAINDILRVQVPAVRERISGAARRAGRDPEDVLLVAVTKNVHEDVLPLLGGHGLYHLAENRPQTLWRRATVISARASWHLIGHLQRNKVEKTLPLVQWVHAVDSLRLLHAVEEEATRQDREVHVLLQVNASREGAKHGFAVEEMGPLVEELGTLHRVRVGGLMTMAALEEDPEKCRPTFRLLRQLRDDLAPRVPQPHALKHLSMGMSNDFEVAVEEGATMVRLGSVLFEGLPGPG